MLVFTLNPNLLPHTVHIKSSNTHINKQKHTGHRPCIIQITWKAREDMEGEREAAA